MTRLSTLVALSLTSLAIGGCASSKVAGTPDATKSVILNISPEVCLHAIAKSTNPDDESSYRIQPGDLLDVHFYMSPEFDDELTVRPDGKIAMREVGELMAANRTSAQLASAINEMYSSELRAPAAIVEVKATPSRQIFVDGQVSRPGAFPLEPQMSAMQAVAEAGGLTDTAAPTAAVLIRRNPCGRSVGIGFDLARAAKQPESNQDVRLLPGDIVYIPRSNIGDVDLFVQQYVKNLIPIQPYLPIM
jgi:polysaccharide export outer membrane protein